MNGLWCYFLFNLVMNILASIFMINHFDELHKQGITHIEMSLRELKQLLMDDKITEIQFIKIFIDNIGIKQFMKYMQEVLMTTHGKEILIKIIPDRLKMICEEPKK